ncbi:SUKH-4 family immunity protein [Streptomyces nigrescens]
MLRDWPRGGIDHTSAEEGMPGRVPFLPPSAEPLTASRVDAAFAPALVVRFPEEALPAGLRDSAARAFLREVGLPKQWRSYKADFVLRPEDEPAEVDESAVAGVRLPDGTVAADLLALGRSVHGALYLHRHDGTVHIAASSAELGEPGPVLVELAPDLEVFTRCLEAVRRYLSAVSAPYPGEPDMTEVFAAEMDALAPGLLDPDTPRGVLWSHFTWALTEWDGDLFWLP